VPCYGGGGLAKERHDLLPSLTCSSCSCLLSKRGAILDSLLFGCLLGKGGGVEVVD
jgi:hypothetical protein